MIKSARHRCMGCLPRVMPPLLACLLALPIYVILLFLVTGFVTESAAQEPAKEEQAKQEPAGFERHRLALQTEMAQVIAYDLDGDGGKELLVVETDRGTRRAALRLRIFKKASREEGGGFHPLPAAAAPLPADLAMIAVGRFPSGAALVLLLAGRLELWPWEGGRFNPVRAGPITQESIFVKSGGGIKSGLEWIADLDGDGYDEIIVPLLDGFQVLRVWEGWEVTPHQRLASKSRSRLWNYLRKSYLAYRLPSLRLLDIDHNGWKDVLAYSDGLVQIFYLSAQPSPAPRAPDIQFDLQPPRPFDPKEPRDPPLKLEAAEDLNGDGLLDFVGSKVAATDSAMNTNTRVLVYYGRPAPGEGGFTLPTKPDQVFATEGFTQPVLVDINGDGNTDLALVNVEIGFWTMIRALISRTVSAETAFYLMAHKGKYPQKPSEVVSYSVEFSLGRFTHQPITAFGDFNADGRPDLLLSVDKDGLGIHLGVPEGVWDDDYDYLIEEFLPIRGKGVRVTDIDGDGRDDLIFIYNRNDIRLMPEVNRKFTVLLSKFPIPKQKIAGNPKHQR